jgi:hypothetical protein
MLWMLGVLIDTVEEVDQQPDHLEAKILNHWILSYVGKGGGGSGRGGENFV